MFCARCGNLVPDRNSFCNACGMTTAPANLPTNVASPTPLWQALFAEPKTDAKAIANLVFGLSVLPVSCCAMAIILGHLSLSEVGKSSGWIIGKGLATEVWYWVISEWPQFRFYFWSW